MLNMMPNIIEQLVSTVDGIDIDRVAVVDSGSGEGVSKVVGQMPNAVISLAEQIHAATGIDVLGAMRERAGGDNVIDASVVDTADDSVDDGDQGGSGATPPPPSPGAVPTA